jgi:uncharacterized membrane protein HdeD (DUF308 family)
VLCFCRYWLCVLLLRLGILCFCFLTVSVSVFCQLRGLFYSGSVFLWVLRCRLYTTPCIAVLVSFVCLVQGALIIFLFKKKKMNDNKVLKKWTIEKEYV